MMFPNKLYKAFPSEKFARSFVEGSIRFSTLAYYRKIEDDSRRDQSEGAGKATKNGEILVVDVKNQLIHCKPGVESLYVDTKADERFICCFSIPREDGLESLPTKFGEYYVVVHEPKSLVNDIEQAISSDVKLHQNPPCLEASPVRYDKGAYIGEVSDLREIQLLGWTQKPPSYSDEREYRLQFWFSFCELIGSPEHYAIQTKRSLSYCEIIRRQL